jgi:Type I phosphodiesterase / nucleotide pyrophosphatase
MRGKAAIANRWFVIYLVLFAISTWAGVPAARAAEASYVIQISVDGLRADILESELAQDSLNTLPNFARFVAEGATTFNARSDYGSTVTLPNHVTLVTGRPVVQPVGQPNTVHHGWIWNSDPAPTQVLHATGNPNVPYVASVFDVVHDAGLSTALFAGKTKFVLLDRSYDVAHGAPDPSPPDDGTDKIDRYLYVAPGSPATGTPVHTAFLTEMAASPTNYCLVHYLDLDAVGHASGWESVAWKVALRRIDGFLGDVLTLLATQPLLLGRTTVLVTADHGGSGFDHSIPDLPADYTIPFFAWGAGVTAGADLYALNATTRADPWTARPDYNAVQQPIRNGDAANLALRLLGLGPVPGSTIDAAQDLVLREPTAARSTSWTDLKGAFR